MPKKASDDNAEIQKLLDNIEDEESGLVPAGATPLKIASAVPEPKHDPQRIEIISDDDAVAGFSSSGGGGDDAVAHLATQIMREFGSRTGEIWTQLMEDRGLLDKYIELFSDRISDPEKTKTANIEALTTLLTTKAATSMNATKMLDSIAKMIAAIKNMNIDGGGASIDIDGLLGGDDNTEDFDPNNP